MANPPFETSQRRTSPAAKTPLFEEDFEVFFDGQCPLCSREIRVLRWLDRRGRVRFTDIAMPSFDAAALGLSLQAMMDRIHGRLPDGTLVDGVEVFRQMYSAIGLGWLIRPTRLFGVRHLLDVAYDVFAKNRFRVTGRCADDICAANAKAPSSAVRHPT